MLSRGFSVFEEDCVTYVPGGHEHLLSATPWQLGSHFIKCWVLAQIR